MSHKPERLIQTRRAAEALARERAAESPDIGTLSPSETQQMLHDLRVHQIELEMQNEELRCTEAQLESARGRYFDLYDLAPVGYCTLSAQGIVLEANLTVALLLGMARGDLVGLGFSRFIGDQDRDAYYLCRKRVLATGAPESREIRMLKADGTMFWGQIETVAAEGDQDAPAVRLALSDITNRKLTEAAVRMNAARYRSLFDSTLDAIILSAPDGRILAANASSCRLFNRTEEEIKQIGRDGILDPADPRVARAFEERDRTGSFRGELTLLRRNGSKFEGDVSAAASKDKGGTIRASMIIREVTERKEAEQALRSALGDNRALLHEIHHRVKNDLQVITSLLSMEARRHAESAARTVLKDMQSRINALALLHETLYRSGTFASVDLGVYLAHLSSQSFKAAADNSERVKLELDLAPARAPMDQAIPCGLLVNELISNALKHGFPEGRTGVVRVVLRAVDGRPTRRLSVTDTGVGLPPDMESRRDKSLGLQLASDLARQIGGRLEVGPGPETAFAVTFKSSETATTPATEAGIRDP